MSEDPLAELFSDSLAPEPPPREGERRGAGIAERARRRAGTGLLAAAAVAAGLLPLYGDPRSTPLTHPLWARMILRALELSDPARAGTSASEVFGALAWTESLVLPAVRYSSGEGVAAAGTGVRAADRIGEVRYTIPVVRGGEYRIRCLVSGDPSRPVAAEVGPLSGGVIHDYELTPPLGSAGWVPAGEVHLDPGTYTAAVLLPPGSGLEVIEVAPPCLRPIEPPDGWRQRAVTTRDDLAVTLLQALDAEHALPPAALPLELAAGDVQTQGEALSVAAAPEPPRVEGLRLEGGPEGVRAVAFVEIADPGLYTLSAFATVGEGLSFLADGCSKSVLCPRPDDGLAWRPVLTRRFDAGRHHIDVHIGPGARIEGLRLERKRDLAEAYVTALRSLGFDPGPAGPVSRAKAEEAVRFLERLREDDPRLTCGDVPYGVPTAVAAPALVAGAPGATTTPGPTGMPTQPLFPLVGEQEPASPVVPAG